MTNVEKDQKQNPDIVTELIEMNKRLMEQVEKLMAKHLTPDVPVVKTSNPSKNVRGGKHQAQPVLDKKSGKRYPTKSLAGVNVAGEYGVDIYQKNKDGSYKLDGEGNRKINTFVWYLIPQSERDTRFELV